MRKAAIPTIFAVGFLAAAPCAHAHAHAHADVVTVAVYGDAPYGTKPSDTAQVAATPAFIQAINADPDVALVLHVGDIHSGKTYCTEAYDRQIFDLWTAFADPLVYIPGDNEWADCNKAGEGGGVYNATTGQIDYVLDPATGLPIDYAGGDPIANLDLIRSIFFSKPGVTLGKKKLVLSQGLIPDPLHKSDAKYVENVMFVQSQVLFVTINVPGGSNDDLDVWYAAPVASAAQTKEKAERDGADLRWLDYAFGFAKLARLKGVVVQLQADMWDPEKGAAHQAGYEPYVQALAQHTTDFGGPVLLLNGDSHVYKSDSPLSAADPSNTMHPGYDVPNLHRIVVHGSTTPLEWLKLTVDPSANAPQGSDAFGPFGWTRMIQP